MAADLAIKEPVRVATTGNIPRSGLQTIDGVAIAAGDRVLVRAQTNSTENGIYVAASGNWTRATDFDGAGEVTGGTKVFVTEGTLFGEGFWHVAGSAAVTPGGAITFEPEFLQTGTGSVPRTLQNKARDLATLNDKSLSPAPALADWATDFAAATGGFVLGSPGTYSWSQAVAYGGQSLHFQAAGAKATIYTWDGTGPAIELNSAGSAGQAYSVLEGFGFVSNNTNAKTAIELVNCANCRISDVAIVAFPGDDTIGIKLEGRQFTRLKDLAITCARPILFGPNITHPTIATDHDLVEGCELASTVASRHVLELEDGTSISNLTIRNTGFVGGRDSIRWVDSSTSGASVHLHIQDGRTEQGMALTPTVSAVSKANPAVVSATAHGLETGDVVTFTGVTGMTQINNNSYTITRIDANSFSLDGVNSTGFGTYTGGIATSYGYAIRLVTSGQSLQELLVDNFRCGRNQNGFYLRRCLRTTFINCTFDQVGGTAVDIELVPGGRVEFINCTLGGSGTAAVRIGNARCVSKSAENRTTGFSETWVYDNNGASGTLVSQVPHGGLPTLVPNNTTLALTDDVFCGYVSFVTSEDMAAEFFLAGGSHSVSERDDVQGFFTPTANNASTLNVYWDAGTSRYVLQNRRGVDVTVSAQLRSGLVGY